MEPVKLLIGIDHPSAVLRVEAWGAPMLRSSLSLAITAADHIHMRPTFTPKQTYHVIPCIMLSSPCEARGSLKLIDWPVSMKW